MCKFASGIMKHKMAGIWWDMDLDSHTDIMEKFGIKDGKEKPPFVKFEMTPKDGDQFNHARDNWVLNADQDHIPDWWDRAKAEEMFWPILQTIFAERFLIGVKDHRTIEIGRWYLKDSNIESVMGGTIKSVMGGTIKYVMGGTIESVMGGTIKAQYGGMIIRGKIITVCDKSFTLEYVEASK